MIWIYISIAIIIGCIGIFAIGIFAIGTGIKEDVCVENKSQKEDTQAR